MPRPSDCYLFASREHVLVFGDLGQFGHHATVFVASNRCLHVVSIS